MIELRPYQTDLIADIRQAYREGHRAVAAVAPTGSGKTVMGTYMAQSASAKRNVVWWLTHRRELAAQASQSFHRMGLPHSMIAGGHVANPHATVQIASIPTIARRLGKLPPPNFIVFDETHHIGASQWDEIFHAYPGAKILGLTATPWRLDGQGLGRWYTHMALGPAPADLIEAGALSPYRLFAPSKPDLKGIGVTGGDYAKGALADAMNKPQIVGDAIQHYRELCPGKRAVVFAAGIENSHKIAQQFRDAGIPAEHVDGTMPTEERDAKVRQFEAGQTLILTNDSLFGEGFDVPAIEAVILLRPTKSLSLYLQMVGRALRPSPGKDHAIILDHAGNSSLRADGGQGHGLPDDPREWSLDDREKRKASEKAEVAVKQCRECFHVFRPAPKCPACGHVPPVQVREIEVVEGKLEEVTNIPRAKFQEQGQAQTLDDLIQLGRMRGYKNPTFWAQKVWSSRQGRRAA